MSMHTMPVDNLVAARREANSANASSWASSVFVFVRWAILGFCRKLMWARPGISGKTSARAIACSGLIAQSARWIRFRVANFGRYLQMMS